MHVHNKLTRINHVSITATETVVQWTSCRLYSLQRRIKHDPLILIRVRIIFLKFTLNDFRIVFAHSWGWISNAGGIDKAIPFDVRL